MRKWILGFLILSASINAAIGQSDDLGKDSIVNVQIMMWLEDLYVHGAAISGDSVVLNEETLRLLEDSTYRKVMYPEVYTWEVAIDFMSKQELKKAFWFMLNLYLINDENKDLVVKSILTYNSLFNMDEVMEATYKTYGLLDPEIGEIVDGFSEVIAPHILEKKLQALKEILFYIEQYDKKEDNN